MAPKQADSFGNRLANGLVFAFFVAAALGIAATAIDSEGGHAVVNKLRAISGADERVITATVAADSIELRQEGPDSLKNCRVAVNEEFVYQAGSIAPPSYTA